MYLAVVAADNQCLEYRNVPEYDGIPENTDRTVKNKSPMSRNHYNDASLETVDGARCNCMQCHVPQSNATSLVENTFR